MQINTVSLRCLIELTVVMSAWRGFRVCFWHPDTSMTDSFDIYVCSYPSPDSCLQTWRPSKRSDIWHQGFFLICLSDVRLLYLTTIWPIRRETWSPLSKTMSHHSTLESWRKRLESIILEVSSDRLSQVLHSGVSDFFPASQSVGHLPQSVSVRRQGQWLLYLQPFADPALSRLHPLDVCWLPSWSIHLPGLKHRQYFSMLTYW